MADVKAARVAIVGAGIAGASCADFLARHRPDLAITVFDLGRGPGGRSSTRRQGDLKWDHGAQYVRGTSAAFSEIFNNWTSRGLIHKWAGRFGNLNATDGTFSSSLEDEQLHVGVPGMNGVIAQLLAQPNVTLKFSTAVSSVAYTDHATWRLQGKDGESLGDFDATVAADRLVAVAGSPGYVALDSSVPPSARALLDTVGAVRMRPCFVLMLAYPQNVLSAVPFDGAWVSGSSDIAWISRDTSKPSRTPVPPTQDAPDDLLECWLVQSTEAFAQRQLAVTPLQRDGQHVAQTTDVLQPAADQLLAAFVEVLRGHVKDATAVQAPAFARAHRWGGAFPVSDPAGGADRCVADLSTGLFACGDYCVAPNVEGAAISGVAAAAQVLNFLSSRPLPAL